MKRMKRKNELKEERECNSIQFNNELIKWGKMSLNNELIKWKRIRLKLTMSS